MSLHDDILAFREAYWGYRNDVLAPTEAELRAVFDRWRRHHYWERHEGQGYQGITVPSPVQRTDIRIKRLESVEDKIRRHPDSFEGWTAASFQMMDDVVGARIVVYVLSDFTLVHNELHSLADDLEICTNPRTMAYLPPDLPARLGLGNVDCEEKKSGYASVHYRCRLRRSVVDPAHRPWIEVQLRTLAEDAWAEVHHLIGYKRDKDTFVEVEEETRLISAHMKVIDEHFDLLRNRLADAQSAAHPRNKHKINAENLPAILREVGMRIDQREVDGLLRAMTSRGIRTVKEFRARATTERVALIRSEWFRITERKATAFDIAGVLGNLTPKASVADTKKRIEEWANVANRWGRRREDEDVYRLLRALRYHGVRNSKAVSALATHEHLSTIRSAWTAGVGREPSSLETISVLSLASDSDSSSVQGIAHRLALAAGESPQDSGGTEADA
jgi:ppGpp synthetase/RelA/SpoT-type nucleotidyltranferase